MAEMTEVRSEHVVSVGLDDAGALVVQFKDGATYVYDSAGEAEMQDLLTSPSPGGYVSRHLRRLPARRIS